MNELFLVLKYSVNFNLKFRYKFNNLKIKKNKNLEIRNMALDYFSTFIFSPMVFIIGLFGNTMGFVVVSRKRLKNMGPILIYKFLFLSDIIYSGNLIFIKLFIFDTLYEFIY